MHSLTRSFIWKLILQLRKHGILKIRMRINPEDWNSSHWLNSPCRIWWVIPDILKEPVNIFTHGVIFIASHIPSVFSFLSIKYPSVCVILDIESDVSAPQGPIMMSDLWKETFPPKELKGFVSICNILEIHVGMDSDGAMQKHKNKKEHSIKFHLINLLHALKHFWIQCVSTNSKE